jgi:hypothetical protein
VLIDVEGEYTEMDQPTEDPQMLIALARRGQEPHGVKGVQVFHLIGRETSRRKDLSKPQPFCLRFSDLSPYVDGRLDPRVSDLPCARAFSVLL